MITSINLCSIPFQSNTDSTRLQMSSKQIQQAITSLNCEIPYVVNKDFHQLSNSSNLGINIAKENGTVLHSDDELIIYKYNNDETIYEQKVPPVKKCYANYGSTIRHKLKTDTPFNKDDVIFEYDCFRNGIPTPGYNVFTAYMPWFGFNHEDSLVVSESFAYKTQAVFIDRIYLPISEHTLLQKAFNNNTTYFPNIGDQLFDNIFAINMLKKKTDRNNQITDTKNSIKKILKGMNLSELINIANPDINSVFNVKTEKTKLDGGTITGFKIHQINKKPNLINKDLQKSLDSMYNQYVHYIQMIAQNLQSKFSLNYAREILQKYYVYTDKDLERHKIDLRNVDYLIEFEITKKYHTNLGDKLTNMYAGKGIVSQILPDELRPYALESEEHIDMVYNPFGVFSRMNHGQVIHCMVGKTVRYYDKKIRQNPEYVKEYIFELNDIIKDLDLEYSREIEENIISRLDDKKFHKSFVDNIVNNNLFIEAKGFEILDIKNINKKLRNANETIIIPKKTLTYIKQKLKIDIPFTITDDIKCHDVFCGPAYIMKLHKLTSKIINARDFGPVQGLTGQPTKGRAKDGGSKLGQMEIDISLPCIVIYMKTTLLIR